MAEQGEDSSEKTLDPTQKKLDDAIERGDVAKSHELNTWFILAAATLGMFLFAQSAAKDLTTLFAAYLGRVGTIAADGTSVLAAARTLLLAAAVAIALPLLLLVIASAAANMVQHRLLWTLDPITPRLQKISPMAGFTRIFGKAAWVNFAKGIAKIIIVGCVIAYVAWPERQTMAALVNADMAVLAPYIFSMLIKLMAAALVILAFVAGGDWLYQRNTWYERQKMSVQEMKEEYKQSEGNPEVKAKLKQLRRQRSAKRMMSNVPKASVVITNPTHYAVALRYENGMGAPICVAKGADNVALKIREIATASNVAIVENPPLARALFATVEVEDEIPGEHYKAVAEVISYVMKLKSGKAWRPLS